MKNRKKKGKRLVAGLVLLSLFVAMLPISSANPQTAEAASFIVDTNLTIALGEDGSDLYRVVVEDGYLKVQVEYYHNSTATLSYHTEYLYFTADDTDGNPKKGNYESVHVGTATASSYPVKRVEESAGNKTYTTFMIPTSTMREFAESLTGKSANGNELDIYMSQGFVIKTRSSSTSSNWKYGSTVYSTETGIQGAASWSATTRFNFEAYFDVPLTLDLTTYNLTVQTDNEEAGYVSGSQTSIEAGQTMSPKAHAYSGCSFSHWEVTEGFLNGSVDLTRAELNFSMPSSNVTLVAHFNVPPTIAPTRAPVTIPPTPPIPTGVTPTPTDTPSPTPTPKPTYIPQEDSKEYFKYNRYYTTDAGYTMEGVYKDNSYGTAEDEYYGYVAGSIYANGNGTIRNSEYTTLDNSYKVGTDASGNTWYFIASGSNALYVHPKVYDGNDADTSAVKNIVQLIFPSTITYNGTAYTVTSIGGGGSRYKTASSDSNYQSLTEGFTSLSKKYATSNGRYAYTSSLRNTSATISSEYETNAIQYAYGVAGNGEIVSTGNYTRNYINGVVESWTSANSYYVYNTTLRYVTIPSTVTTIEDYAFYHCQALEKLSGGAGVTSIGNYAFTGATHLTAQKSVIAKTSGVETSVDYYFYNGACSLQTDVRGNSTIKAWEDSVSLSEYMELAAFPKLAYVKEYAFSYHTNLYDVTLPTSVVSISSHAFSDCELNSIRVPGKTTTIYDHNSTLGTKGTPDTIIYTVPESKAMFYGLTYTDYYTLRCGYEVTYHNNASPAETVARESAIRLLYNTSLYYHEGTNTSGGGSYSYEIALMEDKTLWMTEEGVPLASEPFPGTKFTDLYSFHLSEPDGFGDYDTICYDMAIAENGEVYLYDSSTGSWSDFGVPVGSTCHQWANVKGYEYSSDGVGWGESDYTTVYLYYLRSDGALCRTKVYRKGIYESYYNGTTTTGTLDELYAFQEEVVTLLKNYGFVFTDMRVMSDGSISWSYNGSTSIRTYNQPEICLLDKAKGTGFYGGSADGDTYNGYTTFNELTFDNYSWSDFQYSGVFPTYNSTATSLNEAVEEAHDFITGYEFWDVIFGCTFERSGYEFTAWNTKADGTGKEYRPGDTVNLTSAMDLYAQWKELDTTIRYAPNGGNGTMSDDVYARSVTTVTLQKNAYERPGHKFLGWNTKPDGSGSPISSVYADEATITVEAGITILYAQWEPITATIYVASDEIRAYPPGTVDWKKSCADWFTLEYDEEFLISTGMSDRSFTVSYDLNKKSSMSTTPNWKTAQPLTEEYTKASLKFLGWELYEEREGEYHYMGFYEVGDIMKNTATKEDMLLILFPFWGGDASYVKLPTAECYGYDFIGWTTTPTETKEENILHAEDGSGAQYKPTGNQTLYAYYIPKEYEVGLVVEASETDTVTQEQTTVVMTFDKKVPDVLPPSLEKGDFLGYYVEPDGQGTRYYDASGNGLEIWTVYDGSIEELYAHIKKEVLVTLDGRGATKQEQTEVIMIPGEVGPDVLPPEKTGYTFQGYYTGTRGSGTKYFDAKGKGVAAWEESSVTVLYAYWKQNAVDYPEKEEGSSPEVLPEEQVRLEVIPDQRITFFSEKYQVEEGIPSTETVDLHATCGAFLFSCLLERKSGIEMVRMHVTVTYRTQYEEPESEVLVISESRTKTMEVMVPRAWSYWKIREGGVYLPENIRVENGGLEEGAVEIRIRSEGEESIRKPSYWLTAYEEEERFSWPSYDADGTPSLTLLIAEEQYIISDTPGEPPETEEYLRTICNNVAWQDQTQFAVRSDGICVEGILLLSDNRETNGHGATPQYEAIGRLKEAMLHSEGGVVQNAIPLLETAENGAYSTTAEIVFRADEAAVGEITEKRVAVTVGNDIFIHTPVVCVAKLRAEHETEYQCETVPEGSEVLVLDETGTYSDFVLQISNYGYHSEKKGYGLQSYTGYLARKDGKPQNEVRFPVAVWVDIGNDKDNGNDILLSEEVWYTIGTEAQRFYLPFWVQEGDYCIEIRAVAVNAKGKAACTEETRNLDFENYVATSTMGIYITGRLYGFTVFGIGGNAAWKEVQEDGLIYTVGCRDTEGEEMCNLYETLPLRNGVHPYYRNIGGLPSGGSFSFRLKSVGSFFTEGTKLTLVPSLLCLNGNEYEEVDVYFEKETDKGVFLTKWSEEEFGIILRAEEDSLADMECLKALQRTKAGENAIEQLGEGIGEAVRYWYGSFSMPETFYVAEAGAEVLEYQKRYGLAFTEEFWVQQEPLVLCFSIRLENEMGDVLYYGKLPNGSLNNIWCGEAGIKSRTDTTGTIYPIYGGEVAVLYPGDCGAYDYVIYGIY